MSARFEPVPVAAMRTRLALEVPVEAADGAGGVARQFQPMATLWAALTRLSASEDWQADRQAQSILWRVETHFRPDIDAGMRLRRGGRILDIRSAADPDGRRRRLVIEAEEHAP